MSIPVNHILGKSAEIAVDQNSRIAGSYDLLHATPFDGAYAVPAYMSHLFVRRVLQEGYDNTGMQTKNNPSGPRPEAMSESYGVGYMKE